MRELESHPGWRIYSEALSSKAASLAIAVQAAVRAGEFGVAAVRQAAVDVIRDCLDLPRLEANNAELTLGIEEREEQISQAFLNANQKR